MTKLEHPLVSDAFDLLAKNTELSLGEYTSITQCQADFELFLSQHLRTFSTVLYGAFSRKTIVSPLSGSIVDMLVIFRDNDIKNVMPSRVFTKLSEVLIEQYPDAHILNNRNTLTLPLENFTFKIHPCYPVSTHTYMLPDENFDDWVKYDLNIYNEIFIKENVRHKGKLIEIIRMMKTWNRVSGNLFNGYYLEILITEVLSSYEMTSHSETLRHIFHSAFSEVAFNIGDPANIDFQVEGLNDIENVITAMKLVKRSYQLADEAVAFEQDDEMAKAINNWNKLFFQAFPTQVDMMVGKARSNGVKGADALRMLINKK